MASFEGMLVLLDKLGFFSVIIPFILVYVIIFALLEKTKVLGVIKVKIKNQDEELARSNFNSIVAFCIAILFVVAQNLVFAMEEFMNWVVILIILSMSIVLAFGFLGGDIKSAFKNDAFEKKFKPILLVMITIILLIAILKAFTGTNLLAKAGEFLTDGLSGSSETFASLLFFVVIIGVVALITKAPKKTNNEDGEDKNE